MIALLRTTLTLGMGQSVGGSASSKEVLASVFSFEGRREDKTKNDLKTTTESKKNDVREERARGGSAMWRACSFQSGFRGTLVCTGNEI